MPCNRAGFPGGELFAQGIQRRERRCGSAPKAEVEPFDGYRSRSGTDDVFPFEGVHGIIGPEQAAISTLSKHVSSPAEASSSSALYCLGAAFDFSQIR